MYATVSAAALYSLPTPLRLHSNRKWALAATATIPKDRCALCPDDGVQCVEDHSSTKRHLLIEHHMERVLEAGLLPSYQTRIVKHHRYFPVCIVAGGHHALFCRSHP